MWLIVSGDGDVPYTRAYGPYTTEAEAKNDLPEDTDDIQWAVIKLEDPTAIIHDGELVDDNEEGETPAVNQVSTVNTFPANLQPLIAQYGSLDNIPAPNTDVRLYANNKVTQIEQQIRNGQENQTYFETGEGSDLAGVLNSLGINLNATPQEIQKVAELHLEHRYYQELAAKHRPRIGF